MSIVPISIRPPASHPPASHPRAAASSGSAAASGATSSLANTGSVSDGDMGSFFKSLSANLQATVSQHGGGSAQTAANRPLSGMPQHHLHRNEGGSGPVQSAPSQSMAQALKAYGSAAAA
jgi:hypothetical protein